MMRELLQTGCLILGILCLFYFVSIVCYTGLSEWFMWIWVLAGAVFLLQWKMLCYRKFECLSVLCLLQNIVWILMMIAVWLIIWYGSKVAAGMHSVPEQGLDYVIVLGARVRNEKPTRALRKRLDRAVEYAKHNPNTIFILSGGQGPDEEISEAKCMYDYLAENGMNTERMLVEAESTDTKENMMFSAAFLDKEQDSVGLISNNFHICRAMLLAGDVGYQNVCGIPASSDLWMQPHYILREICALAVRSLKKIVWN